MAQQTINLGAAPDDGTGDTLRVGGDKINDNFDELYDETLKFKGSTDCSTNPNYPAALKGDFYRVGVAGKIGGASGTDVEVRDAYYALADNAGGDQATVGTSWDVLQGNTTGAGGSVDVEDEGIAVAAATVLNFTGAGVVATDAGGGQVDVTIAGGGGGGGVDVEDEGVAEATGATVLNFTGAGVTATDVGAGQVDIDIPGGGSALSAMYEDQKAANTSGGASTSGSWIARVLNTEVYDDIGLALHSSTVTAPVASPGIVTWTAHGLIANSAVVFTTTGALPTGLTAGTTYYVIAAGLAANTFEVSATPGGAAINFTGSESGTHTATASAISLAAGTYDVDATTPLLAPNRARSRIRDITNNVSLVLGTSLYGSATAVDNVTPQCSGRFTLAGTALIELQYRAEAARATDGLGAATNLGEVEIFSRMKLTKLS